MDKRENITAKMDELREAAKPLVDYLYKYGSPHDYIIVSQEHTEHVKGEMVVHNILRD